MREKALIDDARKFSADQRKKLAKKGHAMSDGSFPIVTVADLKNAVSAYGRASDKAAAKRHIIKRARALGKTDLLPGSWNVGDSSALHCDLCDRGGFLTEKALEDHAEAVHTHSEVRQLVSAKVKQEHGRYTYLRNIADDWVVWESEGDTGYVLYKASYSVSSDGVVTLGEASEVREKTIYVAVSS